MKQSKPMVDEALGLPSKEQWATLTGEDLELYSDDEDDEVDEFDAGDLTAEDLRRAKEGMEQLKDYRRQLKDIPDVTLRKSHLDKLAKMAEDRFEDMFDRAFNCEDRFAAEMLNAANAMLKIALDAHAKVIDSDIKLIDMQLKKDKMEIELNGKKQLPPTGDSEVIEGQVVAKTRNEMMAMRKANK